MRIFDSCKTYTNDMAFVVLCYVICKISQETDANSRFIQFRECTHLPNQEFSQTSRSLAVIFMCVVFVLCSGIELKHLCLEYMTPWLLNLVRFCKHGDDAKRQRVTAILDKLITMTINEKQMYPSIQAKIWGSLGQVRHAAILAI